MKLLLNKLGITDWKSFADFVKQFFKFGIVGLSSTLIHLGVYYLLVFLGLHYIFANVIAFVVSVCNAYFWNSRYVFAKKAGGDAVGAGAGSGGEQGGGEQGAGGGTRRKAGEARRFIKVFAVYISTFLLGTGLLYLWVDILGISEWLAPLFNICITVPLNFLLNKFWAFR